MDQPTVYVLCGLPGSGKTTYAKSLEKQGVIRLTFDEALIDTYGKEFPPEKYEEYRVAVERKLIAKMSEAVRGKRDVVFDQGFWQKAQRNRIIEAIKESGGEYKLLYFNRPHDEVKENIKGRDPKTHQEITPEMMEKIISDFEPPIGEGEILV